MAERISIIEEIKRGGYEASLITTYNAYLPFYEEVVLRKLIGQGAQHNVVLMDAAQCAHSVAHHPPRLAGRQYSLVPMLSSGAFHPKVILLLGRNKGAVLVGSHNLTLSGFGYNRELTNLIRMQSKEDYESIAAIQVVWQQILGWVDAQGERIPKHLSEMVLRLKDFAPWLGEEQRELPDSCQVLSAQEGAPSLWEQFTSKFNGQADQVLVSGAFFDQKLNFLRQVRDDLAPNELLVGIDPKTVQVPTESRLDGVAFRNASALGDTETEGPSVGYLHAKSLAVKTVSGEYYLATGSANPSAPAWLRTGLSGNTEIMILRSDPEAELAAREMGLLELPEFPELTEEDWREVGDNWHRDEQAESQQSPSAIGICIAIDREIIFQKDALSGTGPFACQILDLGKQVICDGVIAEVDGQLRLVIPEEKLPFAGFVSCSFESKSKTFLVHHQRQIDECARTGSQRRFRDALASLSSDSPDLESLIKCVDKIIFAKAEDVNRAANRIKVSSSLAREKSDLEDGGDLSMDLSDTRKSRKKYRLRHSDDLAYLLDVLIYHLRIGTEGGIESSHEHLDAKGRSEEEQVDSDDEEEDGGDGSTSDDLALQTLSLCHGKVRSLIGRMIGQLQTLAEGEVDFEDAVVRLTGVLAVLRQLRNCDGKVAWVKQGQTAFPLEERRRLFECIVSTLFDGKNSIMAQADEYSDADEIAVLRGLVLWLAWDSGIQLLEKKVFQESKKEKDERLKMKALMLSLAQLVKEDETVIEEAKQSIGPLCSSDMDWLNWVFDADKALNFLISQGETSPADKVSQGDIAYLPGLPKVGARVVLQCHGGMVNLAFFDNKYGYRRYKANAIKFADFEQLAGVY